MKQILDSKEVTRFRELIGAAGRIVVTCHLRPDGDALGSALGIWHILRTMGKDVLVVVPDRPPRSLGFLPGMREVVVSTLYDSYSRRLIKEADLLIMCDLNAPKRLGEIGGEIVDSDAKKILIDHHLGPEIYSDVTFSHPEMSSTCELMFRLIAAAGYYHLMNVDAATCLLTGLITDTQNFTVNCNNPDIYEIQSRLLEQGADKKLIVDEAIKSTTLDALRLRSFALLERLEIWDRHRCAVIALYKEDLEKFHYQKGDTEGLVNEPLGIPKVVYSIFLREDSDCIKVSMRSRFNFPVNRICTDLFGGGGHEMAAGGEFYGEMEDCIALLKRSLGSYDEFLPRQGAQNY